MFVSALLAGLFNALAGGGTLFTFPALVAIGLPAVTANLSSTVALFPGYLGAAWAQRQDLRGQRSRLVFLLPMGVIGGVIGGILLISSGEALFRSLVPFLILLASLLLAVSERARNWVNRRASGETSQSRPSALTALLIVVAGIYGGYFGAGLSVIVLAVLGITLNDSLTRLNALKQTISFSVNTAAALFFIFTQDIPWPITLIMSASALVGGMLGGFLAGRIKPAALRVTIVVIGIIVSMVYFIR